MAGACVFVPSSDQERPLHHPCNSSVHYGPSEGVYQRVLLHDASVLQAFYWAGERIARPWPLPVLAWGKARRYCMRSVADRTDL